MGNPGSSWKRSFPLVLLLSVFACSRSSPLVLHPPARPTAMLFANGGFETGDLGGWTVQPYTNPGITFPPQTVADLQLQAGGSNLSLAENGATSTEIPDGLSSGSTLRYPVFGSWSAVVNQFGSGTNVNLITQSFQTTSADVDPADGKIHVRFALAPVLQNPNHPNEAQPYFWVDVLNLTKQTTLFQSFNFSNQPGVPWVSDQDGSVLYTDWQVVDVGPGAGNLDIGDTVVADVYAAGCAYGGHFGEVYVDGFGAFIPGMTVVAHAPASANAGDTISYNYDVRNGNGIAENNSTVNVILPDNTTFVSVTTPVGSCTAPPVGQGGTVQCNLGSINASASASFQVSVLIDPSASGQISHGNYNVHADGTASLIGPLVQTSITVGVVYTDLVAAISDGTSAVSWGQAVQYTVTATNLGPTDANGTAVTNVLPPQLTAATWTCTGASGAACSAASGSGGINTNVDLPAGGVATFLVSANVVAGTLAGTVSNTVTLTAPSGVVDSDPTNNTATDVNGIGTLDVLTVQNAGGGPGTVISSPAGINCGGAGCSSEDASFLDGSQVTLTATSIGSAVFVSWSGCTGTGNTCSFTLSGATTVTATFGYPVDSSVLGGNGTVSCTSPVAVGATSTCTVTPDTGFQTATFTDNGGSALASLSGGAYVLSNVIAAHTVVASFAKGQGVTCGTAGECASGFCTDGYCCDGSCNGQCEACDVAGVLGTCSPTTGVPHDSGGEGSRNVCVTTNGACACACNGTTRNTCTYPGGSAVCGPPSCTDGIATLAATCDGAGACQTATLQSCPLSLCQGTACKGNCTSDVQCVGTEWCAGGVCVPHIATGSACTANDQCGSAFCVDGVCCNAACGGQCQACNVVGSVGVCSAVTGAPRNGRAECGDDGSACAGACDGTLTTACSYPGASLACRSASCAAGATTLPATCNGAGACEGVQTQACLPYICGVAGCKTTCSTNTDCATGNFCDRGACIPKTAAGDSCSANNQCGSGFCVDSVCCDRACEGQCEACDVLGSAGTCSPSTGEPHGDRVACVTDGTHCGGACDGTNPATCGFPGSSLQCRPPTCLAGTETLAAACDGAGHCPPVTTEACGALVCGDTACVPSCQTDAQCVAAQYCFQGQCRPRGNTGDWQAKGAGGCSAGGGNLSWAALLLAVLGLFRALRPRRSAAAAAGMVGLVCLLQASPARAQSSGVSLAYTVDRFQPEGGAYDILGLQSAWVPRPLKVTGFAMVDYAREPLRIVSSLDPGQQRTLLNQQTMLNLGVGISLWGNTEISAVLPVALSQGPRSALEISPALGSTVPHAGVGDLRIAPKVGLLHVGPFALGFALPLSFPTARANAYLGDGRVTVTPRLLLDLGKVGGPRLIGNVGVLFRPGRDFVQVHIGNSFQYGLAAELPLAEITRLAVIASINGEKDFDHPGSQEEPLEALAGVRWHSPVGLGVTVGAGPGLTNGYGTPRYRALLGVSWEGDTYRPRPKPVVVVVREVEVPCPPAIAAPPPPVCPTCQSQQAPPPSPPSLVRVSRKEIALLTPVVFATGSAELAPESFRVLDDAALTMAENPQLLRVRVEGHSDTQGNRSRNLELSKRRAAAVMAYLVSKGVETSRLESAGYGGAQPLEANDSVEGRARNRRVAFVILKRTTAD